MHFAELETRSNKPSDLPTVTLNGHGSVPACHVTSDDHVLLIMSLLAWAAGGSQQGRVSVQKHISVACESTPVFSCFNHTIWFPFLQGSGWGVTEGGKKKDSSG